MTLKKFLLTAVLCSVSGISHADDWLFLSPTHGRERAVVFMIETNSLACNKGICSYWVGALYYPSQPSANFFLAQQELNCKKQELRTSSTYSYFDNGDSSFGDKFDYDADVGWRNFNLGSSPISEIYNYVCLSKQPQGKPYVIHNLTKGKVKRMIENLRSFR